MKRTVLASFLLIITLMACHAAQPDSVTSPYVVASQLKVWHNGSDLCVAIALDASRIHPGRDREVIYTPVLRSLVSADSIEFPAITIAGRNRYFSHLRNGDIADGDAVALAGSKKPVERTYSVAMQPWMENSKLSLRQQVAHCCDAPAPFDDTPLALIDTRPRPVELPIHYVELLGDSVIERKAEGRAYVNFVVNRTELKPDYMNNPEEIGKIIASIDLVKNDPDAVITHITIKGYASPEGSYENNIRLAMGRTQTLKEYVRKHYSFPANIMHTDYEPEDWQGLRDWVVEHEFANREKVLEIIDSDLEPDPRNAEIQKRFPEQYAMILRDVYPWLRHSDYSVRYTFRNTTDVNELKRIFAEAPDRLRPIDFQRIAASFPAGSPEFDRVMLTAVKIWPRDELANLNAASIALRNNEIDTARAYLEKAGNSPEATYTRGALAARLGDLTTAVPLLQTARIAGVAPAAEALKAIEAEQHRMGVTYLISTTTKHQ